MKFKSIEISGFRVYDKPEEATFKFTTPEGEVLNFISLYAPNGFGKTSFYDAVEWGVTNNVSRLWQREKDTEKSISTLRDLDANKKQINLLRNTNASGPTFVRYVTNLDPTPVKRDLKVHRGNKADTKKDIGEKLQFRNVILSQEWISAFLKEDDGEIRYRKFMKNPELQETDTYYQKIKVLQQTNKKRLSELKENIDNLKSKISEDDQEDILKAVNELISKINTDYKKSNFNSIILISSKKEIKELQDTLAKTLIEEDKIADMHQLLEAIEKTIVGRDGLPSKKQYFDGLESLNKVIQDITTIEKQLKKFDRLEAAENELENGTSERDILQSNGKILERLVSRFDKFLEIQKEISDKKETQNDLTKQKSKLEKDIELGRRNQLDEKTSLDSLVKNKTALEKDQESLPKLKDDLEKVNEDIAKKERNIAELKDIIDEQQTVLAKIEDQISELELVKKEAKEGQYALTTVSDDLRLEKVIKDLLEKSEQKFELNGKIRQLNEDIAEQEELNSAIEGFIATGLDIVNRNETDSCPLCDYEYDSYKTLADRISNNQALSASLKILLQQKNTLVDEITKIDTETEKLLKDLMAYYDNELDTLQKNKSQTKGELAENEKLLKQYNRDLQKLIESQTALTKKTKGSTIDDYTKNIMNSLKDVVTKLDDSRSTLLTTEEKLSNLEKDRKEVEGRIELITDEIENLYTDKDVIEIEKWFKENNPEKKIEKEFLEKERESNKKALADILKALEALRTEIKSLRRTLKSLKKSEQEIKLRNSKKQRKDLEKKMTAYEHFLKENLSIETLELNEERLTSLLSEKENEAKAALTRTKKMLEDHKMLEKYADNIIPFLEQKNAKIELEEQEKELAFLKKSVTPIINTEVKKTREFLENKIKDFFYVELINEIYEKIDPHPDFRSVEFKANFDDDTPSLDVFVNDKNNQSTLIPNLYFSTAQINILSLCIFLASALNSKEYDCIFIDDPIQSMDSINVLSTIDLLRSIVVNEEKQIILSTHDENFHNLLKKKIPSKLFKSKFMELESFGKVKENRLLAQ